MPSATEGGPHFPVLRPFQVCLVPWSTSLLALRPCCAQGPTIVNRKVPQEGETRADAGLWPNATHTDVRSRAHRAPSEVEQRRTATRSLGRYGDVLALRGPRESAGKVRCPVVADHRPL